MTTYYRCDGTISNAIVPSTAKQCSTGWLVVDEPVYTLVSPEQAHDLIGAIILLIFLWAVFKIILNSMGIKL